MNTIIVIFLFIIVGILSIYYSRKYKNGIINSPKNSATPLEEEDSIILPTNNIQYQMIDKEDDVVDTNYLEQTGNMYGCAEEDIILERQNTIADDKIEVINNDLQDDDLHDTSEEDAIKDQPIEQTVDDNSILLIDSNESDSSSDIIQTSDDLALELINKSKATNKKDFIKIFNAIDFNYLMAKID